MTIAELVDDVMVTMGMVHDDSLRTRSNVAFNVMMAVNKIKKQTLSKDMLSGDDLGSADMAEIFVVNLANQASIGRRYFDLPKSIYALPMDGGLDYIRYHRLDLPANCTPAVARSPFTLVTDAELSAYWGSSTQSPNTNRPYATRKSALNDNGFHAERVYVWGVDPLIKKLEVSLFVSLSSLDDMNPDDQLQIPDEYLRTIKQLVLQDENWLLNIPLERLRSDGRDFEPGQVVHAPSPISIKSPAQADA